MKILYNTIVVLLALAMLNLMASCEKLIEVGMPGNQIGSDQVFEDTQTANAALAGLYANLYNESVISGDRLGALLGSYTDDLDGYYTGTTNSIMDIYYNQQLPTNTYISIVWTNAYSQIYQANSIIYGVENSKKINVSEKARINGEALLIRSVILFYLQQLFGDIPYVTSIDYKKNQSISKTSSAEALAKLEDDLNRCLSLLPDDYRSVERIYPNRQVAKLMLAKILMAEKQWTKAEVVLKEILQSPLYQFQNDITKVFNKNGTHILWQLKPLMQGNATKEYQLYYFENAAPRSFALTQDLISSFSTGDLRKQNWTFPVVFNQKTFYRYDKYKMKDGTNTDEYSIIFRLDEVYLLLAEALAQQNKIPEAVPYINKTRVRAGLVQLPTNISKESCLNEILMEDRKEFFAEMGHRFMDLKRTDKLNILSAVKTNWKSYHTLWPLPQSDLLANPNLTPQNSGY
ncbi:glycan metabolism protein RagB [Elizabethkingia bruuniana]|uniref:RagB/SusD family nutrient uptake outer membrane protein n=1 Tax=Elizabethkingia bruuniana TaxID=1756149 RepID=UPI00099A6232|nr:RagB/SusD family nutrient uptake outer membrane protein [Elizabethkingia bruuniana]OPC66461.1 glycan metabolism protein RagB [Elizabethkingia bruuniana]